MTRVRAMQLAAAAMLAAAGLLLAAGALAWLAQRPWFDLRRIEVHGDLRFVSAASLRAATAGRLHGNFFTLSLDETRRVFESVPWVAAASVRRVWPDRLAVTLVEHRALGAWDDGRLVSDRGVLFVANPAEAEAAGALVSFGGPERFAREAVERLRALDQRLAPLQQRVVALDVSERASWSARTEALVIELGRDDPAGRLLERLDAALAAYPQVLARVGARPARLDLRYPNGFAVATATAAAR